MTFEITPEARETLDRCYAIILQAAVRRQERLKQQKVASDQVDGPGALATRAFPQHVGTVPRSTTQ
jgi:hypothetical protein